MRFVSTRGTAPVATLREALFQGLAPDGGLYMPESLPRFSAKKLASLEGRSWPEVARGVTLPLLANSRDTPVPALIPKKGSRDGDGPSDPSQPSGESGPLAPEVVAGLVGTALDFPVPIVPLSPQISVLELFHGPTLAFKDVGARFMARLVAHYREASAPRLTVLTATSGDTGGAVAHAFQGLEGIRVVVLFPDGKVTPRQERQFSTLGGNVQAVAVQGDFDDCQRLAKAAFQDPQLRGTANLTSANSINVGRLLPQILYYFHAWAHLGDGSEEILFSVPSGNFGNLAAGLMAKATGLPGVRFLAATNANDGVPVYLRSGRFTPRPSKPTLSTAMDVGDPSNLARILSLYDLDLDRLRKDLAGRHVNDEDTQAGIRRVFHETGYVLDPHSAVGFVALERELEIRPNAQGVLLATAHPAKFAEVVEPAVGEEIPIPPALARCLEGERKVTPMEPEMEFLRRILLEG